MMKIFRNNITISAVLIITLLSHVTVIHTFVKDLVLCINDNGNVKIEKINDCESCAPFLTDVFGVENGGQNLSDISCEDIPLEKFCFEENQLITKTDIFLWKLSVSSILPQLNNSDPDTYLIPLNTTIKNFTLSNYTSVLLLI